MTPVGPHVVRTEAEHAPGRLFQLLERLACRTIMHDLIHLARLVLPHVAPGAEG